MASGGWNWAEVWTRVRKSGKQYLVYVIGYNWLVAITLVPFLLLAVWAFAALKIPPGVTCCVGYFVMEVAAFWMERNWSGVGVISFFRFSLPLFLLYALVACTLCLKDAFGCLLFFALFLGVREALFQFFTFYAQEENMKERLAASFMGGCAYGSVLSILVSYAYFLMNLVFLREDEMTTTTFQVLYIFVLPLVRLLTRLFITQSLSSAIVGPHPFDVLGYGARDLALRGNGGAPHMQLDTLVMYGDFLFCLMIFVEMPFIFAFLLIAPTGTFALAVLSSAATEILYIYVLDTLQLRRQKLAGAGRADSGKGPPAETWAPTYSMHRQTSMVAAGMSGSMLCTPTETTPLRTGPAAGAPPQQQQAPAVPELGSSPDGAAPEGEGGGGGSSFGRRLSALATQGLAGLQGHDPEEMSPRVSVLLHEYDNMWIKNATTGVKRANVFLYQERKTTFLTNLLVSTICVAFACAVIPLLRMHVFPHYELLGRVGFFLAVRLLTDFISCWVLERVMSDAGEGMISPRSKGILWKDRHDALPCYAFRDWLFKALVSLCPLFAVIAAVE